MRAHVQLALLIGSVLSMPCETADGQVRAVAGMRRRPGPTVPPPGPHVRNNAAPAAVVALPRGDVSAAVTRALTPATDTLPWIPPLVRDTTVRPLVGLPVRAVPQPRVPAASGPRMAWRLTAGSIPAPAPFTPNGGRGAPVFAAPAIPVLGLEADHRLGGRARWYVASVGGLAGVPRPTGLQLGRSRPQAEYQMITAVGTTGLALAPFRGWWTPVARIGGGVRFHWMDLPTAYVWQLTSTSELAAGLRLRAWHIEATVEGRWWSSTFDAARLPIAGLRGDLQVPLRDLAVVGGIRFYR